MAIKIALAGNPNSGKTTMFNDLTGSSQYVGNWPGVTVEKKEGKLKGHKDVTIVDLPGVYSLSPYTLEEVVSRDFLLNEKPEAIINIVDASNIERNLYLTTQLIELGIPVVIALNMIDVVNKLGTKIDTAKLSKELGCPVMETSALKGKGTVEVAEKAISMARKGQSILHRFESGVESALNEISDIINDSIRSENIRWYAIKLFERDEKVLASGKFSNQKVEAIDNIVSKCEEKMDDDSESIITNERYIYINSVINKAVKKGKTGKMTTSDKIDKVVTNRFLALPIFALVMFVVYYVSVTTVGTIATDWANDGVFGDGWHLFGMGTSAYEEAYGEYELEMAKADAYLSAAEEAGLDMSAISEVLESGDEVENADEIISGFIYDAENAGIVAETEINNEDGEVEILTVRAEDFLSAMAVTEPDTAEFGVWIPGIPVLVEGLLIKLNTAEWVNGLVLDGIVGGVGAVLGFVPQMLILFLFLAILEDCGYMARIAFIMDRIFRRFGLSGKSFIPMLIGTGCGVPGIMASRTIENESDRKMTIMTTTFIPCGAKLPIIALIAGAFFPESAWVAPVSYFVGVGAIIVSGIILKKTRSFSGEPAPFVMELPQYHIPGAKGVLIHMWERGKSFIVKAGTIIFVACGLVWVLSSFNWSFEMVDTSESMLASIGNVIAPIFTPLGWGDWRSAVAAFTGLIAKENVVGTFGVLYGMEEVAEDGIEIWANLQQAFAVESGGFGALAAFSFLVFNLLCAPCFAAIGAIRREMGSAKWTLIAVGYQTGLAYAVSLVVYQLGRLILGGGFGIGTAVAVLIVIGFIYLLFRPENKMEVKKSVRAVKA